MDKKPKFLSNRLRLDEISQLLAEDILSDNVISKEKILTKSKVYFVFWQLINQFPKKDFVNYETMRDAALYKTFRTFVKEYFLKHYTEVEYLNILKKFNDLEKVIQLKEQDLKTEE